MKKASSRAVAINAKADTARWLLIAAGGLLACLAAALHGI